MAKWLFTTILLFLTLSISAAPATSSSTPMSLTPAATDLTTLNKDIQSCLNSGSSAPESKSSCIQTAFATEENNQINTLYQTYLNFVSQELNGASAGGGGGTGGSSGGSVTRATPSAPPPPVQAPATPVAPASPAPQRSGGIQYY